jgi:hypothetical protein
MSKSAMGKQIMMGGLQVGANLNVLGDAIVDGNISSKKSISATDNITSGKDINAGGNLVVNGTSTLKLPVEMQAELSIAGTLYANGTTNVIGVGSGRVPSISGGGVIVFKSAGISTLAGGEIRYAVPSVSNTDKNTLSKLTIGGMVAGENRPLTSINMDANVTTVAGFNVTGTGVFNHALTVGGDFYSSSLGLFNDINIMGNMKFRPNRTITFEAENNNDKYTIVLDTYGGTYTDTSLTIKSTAYNNIVSIIADTGRVGIGNAAPTHKLTVDGDIKVSGGWYRVEGQQGYFFETYGGGWYMTDTNYLRSYNGKGIWTDGKTVTSSIEVRGFELILGNGDQASRGNSGSSRAVVKDAGNILAINYNNDFTGGVRLDGVVRIPNRLIIPVGTDLWA